MAIRARRVAALIGVGALSLTLLAACGDDQARSVEPQQLAAPVVAEDDGASAAWARAAARANTLDALALIEGRVSLDDPAEVVRIRLHGALPVDIPRPCRASNIVRQRSYIQSGKLVCQFKKPRTSLRFDALVLGEDGAEVGGSVEATGPSGPATATLPTRTIRNPAGATATPDVRLVSSPDFLNGDVGDLADGPSRWTPERSQNSTNAAYEKALAAILDDFAALDPLAVLVAGDLVDGRWGYDAQKTGNFGPVTTIEQRRAALRRAARTYYPQWAQRFADRDLPVAPAIGDHEYGDDPWDATKRALSTAFRSEFARAFTTNADGSPLYADHPEGPARLTAYAARPTPDLQVVSLDVFDITPDRARIGLDPQQLAWLERVLRNAQRDGVEWVIVQGHVPVIWPVKMRGSTGLHYPGGTDSDLWKLLRRYDVDLYLSGEVHDTTLAERDGVVQISHGGMFQFGLTNALTIDIYGGAAYLTLRDYDLRSTDRGPRLWETRREGLPRHIKVVGKPFVIGTAILSRGELTSTSGVLTPPKELREP